MVMHSVDFNGKSYDLDCLNEPMYKAVELAIEFKNFCLEHHIEPSVEIAGVAWNSQWVREQAYIEGKKFEKQRVAAILGLEP